MEKVKILYDVEHQSYPERAKNTMKRLSTELGIELCLTMADNSELIRELNRSPNYKFVIVHMGLKEDNAYRKAERCRSLTSAILIAESGNWPLGEEEALEYFDEYIAPFILDSRSFPRILAKYAFI